MARAVNPHGRVLSFEPSPDTNKVLQRVIEMNQLADQISVRSEAVSSEVSATREFYGFPVVGANANSLIPQPGATTTFRVPTVSIDSLSIVTEVSCLKIDAEGAEVAVLSGADKVIRHFNPAIALDVHPRALSVSGHTVGDLAQIIDGLGYKVPPTLAKRAADRDAAAGGPFEVQLTLR
jgi:FkbM family methyltransferase